VQPVQPAGGRGRARAGAGGPGKGGRGGGRGRTRRVQSVQEGGAGRGACLDEDVEGVGRKAGDFEWLHNELRRGERARERPEVERHLPSRPARFSACPPSSRFLFCKEGSFTREACGRVRGRGGAGRVRAVASNDGAVSRATGGGAGLVDARHIEPVALVHKDRPRVQRLRVWRRPRLHALPAAPWSALRARGRSAGAERAWPATGPLYALPTSIRIPTVHPSCVPPGPNSAAGTSAACARPPCQRRNTLGARETFSGNGRRRAAAARCGARGGVRERASESSRCPQRQCFPRARAPARGEPCGGRCESEDEKCPSIETCARARRHRALCLAARGRRMTWRRGGAG
jgi:hypothetical protein